MAFLASLITASAVGQSVSVSRTVLLPPTFYVGDLVELRLDLDAPPGLELVAPPVASDAGDEAASLLIRDVQTGRVSDSAWQVRILFSSYRPGVVTLPAIDLGGYVISGLRVQTRSLLDDTGETDLRAAKDQLYLPGSAARLLLFGALVLLAPVLAVVVGAALWRLLGHIRERRRRAVPRLRFERAVRRLQGAVGADAHRFLFDLSDLTRQYLGARFQIPARALTTRELHDSPILRQPPGDQLAIVLDAADRRRFDKSIEGDSELAEIGQRAVLVVRQMEEYYRVDP